MRWRAFQDLPRRPVLDRTRFTGSLKILLEFAAVELKGTELKGS